MPGLVGSRSILETPPKMNRVMLFTGKPHLRATSEWASSCKSTETNSSRDERKAMSQAEGSLHGFSLLHSIASGKICLCFCTGHGSLLFQERVKSGPVLLNLPTFLCEVWSLK